MKLIKHIKFKTIFLKKMKITYVKNWPISFQNPEQIVTIPAQIIAKILQ